MRIAALTQNFNTNKSNNTNNRQSFGCKYCAAAEEFLTTSSSFADAIKKYSARSNVRRFIETKTVGDDLTKNPRGLSHMQKAQALYERVLKGSPFACVDKSQPALKEDLRG